jgi:hypothetical protein
MWEYHSYTHHELFVFRVSLLVSDDAICWEGLGLSFLRSEECVSCISALGSLQGAHVPACCSALQSMVGHTRQV